VAGAGPRHVEAPHVEARHGEAGHGEAGHARGMVVLTVG
jgi:hypothetical protein